MFARIVAVGIVGLSSGLLTVVAPQAQAAGYTGWSGYTSQGKRLQFRPWQPRSEPRVAARWRPPVSRSLPNQAQRYPAASRQPALLVGEARYTPPATRAFARSVNTGVRFRPHGGARTGVDPLTAGERPAAGGHPAVQAQFRPRPARQRMTYEQIQAKAAPQTARPTWAYPVTAYPGAVVGLAPFGTPTPYWGAGW